LSSIALAKKDPSLFREGCKNRLLIGICQKEF
jgi:hypothetical protein